MVGFDKNFQFQRLTPAWAGRCAEFDARQFQLAAWPESIWRTELTRTDCVYLALLTAPLPHQSLGTICAVGGVGCGVEAEILTLAVAKHLRRKGIGRALLCELIERARVQGAAEIFLEVRARDHGAQALYRDAGFVAVGYRKKYYPDDDALVMKKVFYHNDQML